MIYIFKQEYDHGCDRVDYSIDYILSSRVLYNPAELAKMQKDWELEILSKPIDHITHKYVPFTDWLIRNYGFKQEDYLEYDTP
jgi:hypothetical protein